MQLGNVSDLLVNVALAWLSALCLFWSMSLIIVGGVRKSPSISWFGWTFILTAFYFGTISMSTGIMVQYIVPELVSFARVMLFSDMATKTALTGWFIHRRRKRGKFIDLERR